jgi:hypothetical protein
VSEVFGIDGQRHAGHDGMDKRCIPLHPLALSNPSSRTKGMEGEPGSDSTFQVFSYPVAEKAALYVTLVDALMEAKERFQLQLRPAEVARHLTVTSVGEEAKAIEALFVWGNVPAFYDPSAPGTTGQH